MHWGGLVGLTLAATISTSAAAAPSSTAPEAPRAPGEHRLEDADGKPVATFVVRPGATTSIAAPAGDYVVVGPDGRRTPLRLDDGERLELGAPGPSTPPARATAPVAAPSPSDRTTPARPRRGPVRHPWVAPLAAAFVPGAGYAVARRPGAAFGTFAAAAGLGFGAIALGLAAPRDEGTALGDPGRSAAREALRHGAFVVTTDALALLWIGQAADAWRRAKGKPLQPRLRHAVSVSVQRASTVGLRPGEPAMARYEDLTLAVLGQVVPRLSLGVADLSVHGRSGGRVTLQAGLRVAGRVLQRDRVWLVVAGGVIFQGTSGRTTLPTPADPEAERPSERGRFGAIVYTQLEARVFVLDRLSLDVAPRLSVPLATRYYGGGKALPRWAPTLELVAGPQVYF
jgi:hypothetical protein